MTYRAIAATLLRFIGVTSLSPQSNTNVQNQQGLNDRDIPDVVTCIQGAVEELFALMPSSLQERRAGAVLRPPTALTIAVTQYSSACVVTGWVSWMAGCTVRLNGDDLENRFISSTELLRPFLGSTASVGATVYADCVLIPATYSGIIAPVSLITRPKLKLAASREEFDQWSYQWSAYGPLDILRRDRVLANKVIAEPLVARADFEALGNAVAALYLRFSPMPGQAYSVEYTGRLAPPTITEANIWDENSPEADPGVSSFLPNASSTLLAFALQRWTGHPNFSASGEQRSEIGRQYQQAVKLLQTRPAQVARTAARFSPY